MFVDVKDNMISNAISCKLSDILQIYCILFLNKGNNKITELRTILQNKEIHWILKHKNWLLKEIPWSYIKGT
jgi:hypothetical protein